MSLFGPPNVERMKARRDVAGLLKALEYQKDFSVRQHAAEALGQIGDDRAVGPLIVALGDEDWRVVFNAAKALGQIGDKYAVRPLVEIIVESYKREPEYATGLEEFLKTQDGKELKRELDASFKHKESELRKAAAWALGQISDSSAVFALRFVLQDESKELRETAIWALGRTGSEEAVDELVPLLVGNIEAERQAAQQALAMSGTCAVLPLIAILDSDKWRARQAAAKALGQIGDKRSIEPLITALKDEVKDVRNAAATALQRLGWEAVPGESEATQRIASLEWDRVVEMGAPAVQPLVHVLKDKKLSVRTGAAQALGKIGDRRAVEPLIEALQDTSKTVRKTAAVALGTIGDERAVEPLTDALQDEDRGLWQAAARALGQMGSQEAVKPLLAFLTANDEYRRVTAVEVLGKIGDPRAIGPLSVALGDESESVRKAAGRQLGQISGPQALVAVLDHQDPNVRAAAAEALDHIGWKPDRSEAGAAYWIAKGKRERCIKIGEPAVRPLVAELGSIDAKVRIADARALGQIGGNQATSALVAILNDKDRYVRQAAAEALDRVGWKADRSEAGAAYWIAKQMWEKCGETGAPAVGPLIAALGDKEKMLRYNAAEQLVRLYKTGALDQSNKDLILAQRERITSHQDHSDHADSTSGMCPEHSDRSWHADHGIGVDFPL